MEFREYLENEQRLEFELFERIHLEDPEWIGESVLDIVKGGGRFIKGVAQSGAGLMDMGDEAIARAMGARSTGRFQSGWERLGRGVGNMGSGFRQAVVGNPPAVASPRVNPPASPVTPAAVQTSDSPSAPMPSAPMPSAPDSTGKKKPLRITVGKDEKVEPGLQSLIDQYRAAKSGSERNRILAVISMRYPQWYQPKLDQARRRERRVSAER